MHFLAICMIEVQRFSISPNIFNLRMKTAACILCSAEAWQQWGKSTGSIFCPASAKLHRLSDLSPDENVWKRSREFGALCSGQDQVWLLAERRWGARGVLIEGKWHDAQSQQKIIYLAHL